MHKLLETTEIFLSTFQTHEKSMDENLSLQVNIELQSASGLLLSLSLRGLRIVIDQLDLINVVERS